MHQPTLRVLQVLQSIASEGAGKRLTELSRELDIPKSTLLPILQTLCLQKAAGLSPRVLRLLLFLIFPVDDDEAARGIDNILVRSRKSENTQRSE